MKCAVIGLGQFGRALALALARDGIEVIAIDIKMELVESVKEEVSLAIQCDAVAHEGVLQSNGIDQVDVLIAAIGANFEAQELVVLYAKQMGISKVIARALTPVHAKILKLVGADLILNPEEEAANRLAQRLLIPNISGYFELEEGFSVIETDTPSQIIGKTLNELDLRRKFRVNLVAIKRTTPGDGEEKITKAFNPVPSADDLIQSGDVLCLVGSDLDLAGFMAEYD